MQILEPQQDSKARLQERVEQLRQKIQEQNQAVGSVFQELSAQQVQYSQRVGTLSELLQQVNHSQIALTAAEQELQIQQETQSRLIQEQRDKQRQLDKLEAQAQALQETQGTGVVEVLQRAKLSGICGLVAQLGKVDPRYQLALEIAAGARLSFLVVEDDRVAASGIQILKQQRGGRATF
ncbi:MAG: chromosome segregation protein SMC, partial [Leptolyngbyaceae cyanobacterium CRU_2_3]|nr:chromosome segregation protein SMC [Leptolyngbyaceae cyanobacterium CRU_2_3]